MGRVAKDLTGMKFGRLTVIGRCGQTSSGNAKWECECECGNSTVSQSFHLRSGQTQSCGCLQRELTSKRAVRHGMSRTPTWNSWDAMVARCYRKTHGAYEKYGGRGITVCERWLRFENFYADMGDRPPGKTLDRINSNGNYESDNCRWATYVEQSLNRGDFNVSVTTDEVRLTVKEYAKVSGLHIQTIYKQIKKGELV